ncbi:MAG: NADH:flavin oxidoreductase/NADH oxidase, partial [Sporomusa sp.]|nr:NADH:flavin oxidoreductase/NADH oxidase [Sporomusa sp.]
VVGGGVAGMEVARIATLRGHQVTLFEKKKVLGGNLIPGGSHTFKKEVRELNAWYQQELDTLNVTVETGTEVTADWLKQMNADIIVLAVGATPVVPKVRGIENPMVMTSLEALEHAEKVGKKVVVIGGGLVGCEMALEYAQEGKEVTIVEALDAILSASIPSPIPNRQMLHDLFEHHNVNILTGHKLAAVKDGKVVLETEAGSKEIDTDSVVLAVGFKPVKSMVSELRDSKAVIYEIGDGRQIGTIMKAIWDGYEIANNI